MHQQECFGLPDRLWVTAVVNRIPTHHNHRRRIDFLLCRLAGMEAVTGHYQHHRIILMVIRPTRAHQEIEIVLRRIHRDVIQCGAQNRSTKCPRVNRRHC